MPGPNVHDPRRRHGVVLHVFALDGVLWHDDEVVRRERVLGARGIDAVEHLDRCAEAVADVVLNHVVARVDARPFHRAVAAHLSLPAVEPAP